MEINNVMKKVIGLILGLIVLGIIALTAPENTQTPPRNASPTATSSSTN